MPVLQDGQIFERYCVIKWLGSGSSGESYEAEDKMLLRKTTLKLIHPWITLPDSVRRQFFREMQGASQLNHRYLTPVLDYGEIDGRIYVARRYASNGSLLSHNGRTWFKPPLTIIDAFTYTHQLAQALQYIHQHGFTHGSLTFANVLVLRGKNTEHDANYAPFLLADVGLGNFVRRVGKPGIEALPVSAAPEQIKKRTSPASDQFALAVLLYFWLAGRPPYLGTPAEVEQQKLSGTITPLTTLNPGVTREQEKVILRALSTSPEDRYPTVLAFAEALMTLRPPLPPAPGPQTPPSSAASKSPETPLPALNPALVPTKDFSAGQEISANNEPQTVAPSNEQPAVPVASASILPVTELASSSPLLDLPLTSRAEPAEAPAEIKIRPEPVTPLATLARPEIPDTSAPEQTALEKADTLPQQSMLNTQEMQTEPETASQSGSTPAEASAEESGQTPEAVITAPAPTSDEASATVATQEAEKPATPDEMPLPTEQNVLTPRLIISPPHSDASYEFLLTSLETNVGRAGASDLLLDQDNLTSRHHALIKRIDDRVLIFDKRSNNGVFINGQQISVEEGYELVDGDHIGIGSYELIFRDTITSAVKE